MCSFGKRAESLAVQFLKSHGLVILARNIRTPDGEIDILAREGDITVVIEVKARAGRKFGSAISAVDARKRRRLRAAAANLLQFAPAHLQALRFDVITLQDGRIRHLRNAF